MKKNQIIGAVLFIQAIGSALFANTGLLDAALKAEVAQVEKLLHQGVDRNQTDSLGRSLLLCAASSGDTALIRLVLTYKPDLSATDSLGANALMWAVHSGNLDAVKLLKRAGVPYKAEGIIMIDIMREAYYGSPLNCAAARTVASTPLLRYLVDSCKAAVNEPEITLPVSAWDAGWTPIISAAYGGDTLKVEYLVSKGANVNALSRCDCQTPLSAAPSDSNAPMIHYLYKKGAKGLLANDDSTHCNAPLFYMLENQYNDTNVLFSVKQGLSPATPLTRDSSVTLFTFAAFMDTAMLKSFDAALKGKRFDHADQGFNLAAKMKRPEALGYLIKWGIQPVEQDVPLVTSALKRNAYDNVVFTGGQSYSVYFESANEDARALHCLKLLQDHGYGFKNEAERVDGFVESVRSGYSGCVEHLLSSGISLDCIQPEENLLLLAINAADTITLGTLIAAGKTLSPYEMLYGVSDSAQCPILRYVVGALSSLPPQKFQKKDKVLSCALLKAAQGGCLDVVKSLHGAGVPLRSVRPDREEYEELDENSYDAQNESNGSAQSISAFECAVHGNPSLELVRYVVENDKKLTPAQISSAIRNTDYFVSRIDTATFAYLLKRAGREKRDILRSVFDESLYIDTDYFTFLLMNYRTKVNRKDLLGLYARALKGNGSPSLAAFKAVKIPSSTKDNQFVLTALLEAGDTTHAAALLSQSGKLPSMAPLALMCLETKQFPSYSFLRNHGYLPSTRELQSLWPLFVQNFTTGDSTLIMALLGDFLARGASPACTDSLGNSLLVDLLQYCGEEPSLRTAVALQLLSHNTNRGLIGSRGATLLGAAAQSGNLASVSTLLKQGADVNKAIVSQPSLQRTDDDDQYPEEQLDTLLTPLMYAAYSGHTKVAELLLASGADISTSNAVGATALDIALDRGYSAVALLLLNAPSGYDFASEKTKPTLKAAVDARCSFEVIHALVHKGFAIDVQHSDGATVMHAICSAYADSLPLRSSLLQLLLEHKGRTDIVDDVGYTPLHRAIWHVAYNCEELSKVHANPSPLRTIEQLLDAGADINARTNEGQTPLHMALSSKCETLATLFVSRKANVNSIDVDGQTALHLASALGDPVALMSVVLNAGASLNVRDDAGRTPLLLAASRGDAKAVDFLVKKGADLRLVDKEGFSVLHYAAQYNDVPLIQTCLKAGININSQTDGDETALHIALVNASSEAFCALIAAGADPLVRRADGSSLVHTIARTPRNIACLDRVLKKLGTLDERDDEGETPLYKAAAVHSNALASLVSAGANINHANASGQTPLMSAAYAQQAMNVALALKKGAVVNSRDNYGKSALHYAVEQANFPIAQLLINAGADVNGADEEDRTPLLRAALAEDTVIVAALLKAGARSDTAVIFEKLRRYFDSDEQAVLLGALQRILTTHPDSLPPVPAIDMSANAGFWWFEGTMDMQQFKRGSCFTGLKENATLETSEELFEIEPYQLTRYTYYYYEFETPIVAWQNTVVINSQPYSVHKTGTILILCNQDENMCRVYQYAGKKMPGNWVERLAAYRDYEH